ncbi:hypothetical protein PV327_010081 [Microctonus hyperodae]|uniref:NADH dehydrogenase [ubiquinone] iron-sulfur protein 5 n=1 Tax=Microctonus hyperodae TaxID=165561 RepID=A0AA39F2B0_MICHY|nr:hypothetical protein PV327_010081 [Microctonus hyperodae]
MKEKRTKKRKTKPKDRKIATGEMRNENDNESSDERHKKIKIRENEIIRGTKQEWTKVERKKEIKKIMSERKSTSEDEASDLTDMEIESDVENNKISQKNTIESTNNVENRPSSSNSVSVATQREEDMNQKISIMTATLTPFFRNIWTDIFGSMANFQEHPECANRELQVVDCLEAYGVIGGKTKCRVLLDDFRECVMRSKQFYRVKIMFDERTRQIKAGERDDDGYAPPPKMDSY